jgi:hypothetical protein
MSFLVIIDAAGRNPAGGRKTFPERAAPARNARSGWQHYAISRYEIRFRDDLQGAHQ